MLGAVGLGVLALSAVQARMAQADCRDLPSHADLQAELEAVVSGGGNAGLVHRRIRPIHLIAGTQAGDQRPFRVTASG
jgi:hypothetical protein